MMQSYDQNVALPNFLFRQVNATATKAPFRAMPTYCRATLVVRVKVALFGIIEYTV